MRTTVELPPELMRAAKAKAASQGESLKSWFTRAVSVALGGRTATPRLHATGWPVIGRTGARKVKVANADLAAAEAADDLERARRTPGRSR